MCTITSLNLVLLVNEDNAKEAARLINSLPVAEASYLTAQAMNMLDLDGRTDLLSSLRETVEADAPLSTGAMLAHAAMAASQNDPLTNPTGQRVNIRI